MATPVFTYTNFTVDNMLFKGATLNFDNTTSTGNVTFDAINNVTWDNNTMSGNRLFWFNASWTIPGTTFTPVVNAGLSFPFNYSQINMSTFDNKTN
jgi:hypothetical protein